MFRTPDEGPSPRSRGNRIDDGTQAVEERPIPNPHIDACERFSPEAKGKVEAKVRLGRLRIDPTGRRFESLEDLQAWTDSRIERWCETAICPATGTTVKTAWKAELEHLAPLPVLPEPFDIAVTRPG